jgi:hypothetical protein
MYALIKTDCLLENLCISLEVFFCKNPAKLITVLAVLVQKAENNKVGNDADNRI